MGTFLHALAVFGRELAAVRWEFLALALGLTLVRLLLRGIAWRVILLAAYPGVRLRFRSVFGAYMAGVGVNSLAPARAGDAVKLYLIKHRIPDSSYATLAPTLLAETLFNAVVAGGLVLWALSIGVLPTHQVYSRLPSVDWGFFARYEHETAIALGALAGALVVGSIIYIEHGGASRARIARGFAVLGEPRRFLIGVIVPQALSWVLRIGAVYEFLRAFHVHPSIHNALLASVVDSLATLFPATPGGAGTKQGLIVFLFRGRGIPSTLLLAFSVGMNVASVVFNVVVGGISMYLMARTLSWRRLQAAGTPGKA